MLIQRLRTHSNLFKLESIEWGNPLSVSRQKFNELWHKNRQEEIASIISMNALAMGFHFRLGKNSPLMMLRDVIFHKSSLVGFKILGYLTCEMTQNHAKTIKDLEAQYDQ